MKALADRRRLPPTVPVGLVVILAAGYLASQSAPGTVGHFDTVTYVNTAEHVCAGHGWMTSRATDDTGAPAPLTFFGPGFPALLALPCIAGGDPREAIPWVMGASLVAYALATFWLLLLALDDKTRSWRAASIAAVVTVVVIVQPPVLASTASILSDLPGAALTLVCVCLVYRRRHTTQRDAVLLGIAMAMTILMRWGLAPFCMFLGLVAMARAWSAPDRARQVKHLLWTPVVVLITVGSWLVRNFVRTGHITGTRHRANEDPVEIAITAFRGMGSLLRHAHQHWQAHHQHTLYTLTLFCSVGLLIIWLSVENPSRRGPELGLVACGYLLVLVTTRSLIAFDSLNSPRFWLAEWSFLAAAIACWLRPPGVARWLWLANLTGCAAMIFLITLPAVREVTAHADSPNRPRSVAPPLTAASREAIRLHDQGRCTLASNDARLLLPHTGVRIVRHFPTHGPKLEQLTQPGKRPTCLVAFAAAYRPRSAADEERLVRQTMRAMVSRGELHRLSTERGVELWITVPRVRK